MMKLLLALSLLFSATPTQAQTQGDLSMNGNAIIDRLNSDGAKAVSNEITRKHAWPMLAQRIAHNDATLTAPAINSLLGYAPSQAMPTLQAALRTRLQHNTLDGLAALTPASASPFSGAAICRAGSRSQQTRLHDAVAKTHDVRLALQREDCLKATESRLGS